MQQPKQKQRTIAKRSACDRCREHKLRCSRSQGPSDHEPCVRCARARISCVTGAPRIIGRPRIADSHRIDTPDSLESPVPGSVPDNAPGPVPPSIDDSPVDYAQLLTDDADMTSMFFDDEPISASPETGSRSNTINLSDLVRTSSQEPYTMRSDVVNANYQHGFAALTSIDIFEPPEKDNLQINYPPNNALHVFNKTPSMLLVPDNVLNKLARLNGALASQLAQVAAFPFETPDPALIGACVDQNSHLTDNPASLVLEKTSEFASILKQIISPIQDQGVTPLTMPAVLMCLSSHIQILQVFDTLFSRFIPFLRKIPDVVGFFEAAPSISSAGGLPPVKGHLYLKIIVQVIEHEVANVERLMGLPPDLCLVGHRTPPKSLLGLVNSPELLQSIMTQVCSTSETSGRALVMSLRAHLDNLLELVTEDR